jgi:hypothetical protein
MMTSRSLSYGSLALALSLALAACGPTSGTHPASPGEKPTRATPKAAPKAEGNTGPVVEALWKGDSAKADKLLRKILKNTPNDPLARKLQREITEDPHKVLGSDNYPYKVKPGETLWGLAQRILGDPMMFYALARYNEITVPQSLAAGSTIRIPGKLRVETPPPPPKPVEKPTEKPAEKPAATPTPPAPQTPPAPAHDPARAARLRAAGLAAMNKGAIDRAVWLLRQAQLADPGNPLISRDLDRARKIQATVRRR